MWVIAVGREELHQHLAPIAAFMMVQAPHIPKTDIWSYARKLFVHYLEDRHLHDQVITPIWVSVELTSLPYPMLEDKTWLECETHSRLILSHLEQASQYVTPALCAITNHPITILTFVHRSHYSLDLIIADTQ